MGNKMEYFVIFNNGNYDVKSTELLTEKDKENIVYSSLNASAACIKADQLEDEYITKNGLEDTRHYFENMKYKATKPQSLNDCND